MEFLQINQFDVSIRRSKLEYKKCANFSMDIYVKSMQFSIFLRKCAISFTIFCRERYCSSTFSFVSASLVMEILFLKFKCLFKLRSFVTAKISALKIIGNCLNIVFANSLDSVFLLLVAFGANRERMSSINAWHCALVSLVSNFALIWSSHLKKFLKLNF